MTAYRLTHSFRVDAFGKPVLPPPTHGMEAAARYYYAHDYSEADRCCREVIARDPRHFDALHLLGVVHSARSEFADAIAWLNEAADVLPDNARVHYHLGTALLESKEYESAAAELRRSFALDPQDVGSLNNLGNALAGLQQHDDAVDCYRQVLARQPDHARALYNLGRSLAALDRLEEAVDCYRAALRLSSIAGDADRFVDIHANLGQALGELGRYDEARAACHAIAELSPKVAAWNESLILLLLGQYRQGWRQYEGRWGIADHDPPRSDSRVPDLSEVPGKYILLTCEQGHGDMIQFARYAPLLAQLGARVSLQAYVEQKALMQTLDGIDAVIAVGEKEPQADIITPLLSLPLVFGTEVGSVFAQVPYLRAPSDRLTAWQQRMGQRRAPRIGLAWWGSQHIPRRSLSIEALRPVLSLPGVEFHALQKEIPPAQREWLAAHPLLTDHGDELSDFADTAALISLLDLVVTIDTAVAHLAGALGKPVWLMLPHSADWRWLLDRCDSPWYPTARLFRQRRRGDWDDVVADVARSLAAWATG